VLDQIFGEQGEIMFRAYRCRRKRPDDSSELSYDGTFLNFRLDHSLDFKLDYRLNFRLNQERERGEETGLDYQELSIQDPERGLPGSRNRSLSFK